MGSSERLHAALAALPPICGARLREDSLEQCSLPRGHDRHGRAKPRTTGDGFAFILKERIDRADGLVETNWVDRSGQPRSSRREYKYASIQHCYQAIVHSMRQQTETKGDGR